MPFKSEAQRRKFAQMLKEGKITQGVFDAFNDETPANAKLPERASKKPTVSDLKDKFSVGKVGRVGKVKKV